MSLSIHSLPHRTVGPVPQLAQDPVPARAGDSSVLSPPRTGALPFRDVLALSIAGCFWWAARLVVKLVSTAASSTVPAIATFCCTVFWQPDLSLGESVSYTTLTGRLFVDRPSPSPMRASPIWEGSLKACKSLLLSRYSSV